MKLGIMGMPGSGRRTLFEILSGRGRETAGRGRERVCAISVPDGRVDALSSMYKPKKTTPAQIEYQLLEEGGGLALTAARVCDALIHVVKNFSLNGDEPAAGRVGQVDAELVFADFSTVEKRLERIALDRKKGRPVAAEEESELLLCKGLLEKDCPLRREAGLGVSAVCRGFGLVSAKPMLILFNNDEDDDQVPELPGYEAERRMAVRCGLEREIAEMEQSEAADFLAEFGVSESALDRVIRESYSLLGLISFFTVGEDEVKAWTIRRGTAAEDAAEVIHSDIKKGFIRAEVVAYDDLVEFGSVPEARKAGRVRLEGRGYEVRDGDVINFRFNV